MVWQSISKANLFIDHFLGHYSILLLYCSIIKLRICCNVSKKSKYIVDSSVWIEPYLVVFLADGLNTALSTPPFCDFLFIVICRPWIRSNHQQWPSNQQDKVYIWWCFSWGVSWFCGRSLCWWIAETGACSYWVAQLQ